MGNAESAQSAPDESTLPVAATPAFGGDANNKKTLSRIGLISPDAGSQQRASTRQSKQLQTSQIDEFLREKAEKHFVEQNGREPSSAEKIEIQQGLEKSFSVQEMCVGAGESEKEAEQLVLKLVSSKLGGETDLSEAQLQTVLDKLKEVAGPLKNDMQAREKEEAAVRAYLTEKTLQRFIEENSRPPTDQEKSELIESLDESFSSADLVGEEENAESEGASSGVEVAAEILVFNSLCATFEQIQGRSPEEAELQEILEKLQQEVEVRLSPQKAAKAASGSMSEAVEAAPTAGADDILQQLLEAYKQQNGKDPTEDVVKQWISVISDANLDMNDIAGGAEDAEGKRKAEGVGSESKRQKQ
jgi:hypothetical protein